MLNKTVPKNKIGSFEFFSNICKRNRFGLFNKMRKHSLFVQWIINFEKSTQNK